MQRIRKVKSIGCFSLLVILLVGMFFYLGRVFEYSQPAIDVESLVLLPEDIPSPWQVHIQLGDAPKELGQIDSRYIAYNCELSEAVPPLQHHVYVFPNRRVAIQAFEDGEESLAGGNHHWKPPSHPFYESPVAEQFAVYCGYAIGSWVCEAIAQRGQYYSVISSGFDSQCMNWQQFEDILRAIDGKMVAID